MKLLGTFAIIALAASVNANLNEFQSWKQIDFLFPSPAIRQQAISEGKFVPANIIPIDVAVDYRDSLQVSRIFVTFPRFSTGVPASLGFIRNTDTAITPYPNYQWHSSQGRDCEGLTSVFRVAIDECGQMWVLDSGKIAGQQLCQPQLVVFNLRTDQLVSRYRFDRSLYRDTSLFLTPILDVKDPDKCKRVKVYIADCTGFGLIVYDHQTSKAWRVENKYFFPYPNYGKFTIAGESFNLMDGLLAMSITKTPLKLGDSDRSLLFHALASGTENAVQLGVLNNSTLWQNNVQAAPEEFRMIGSRGIQTGAEAMDKNGNLFFVLLNPLALACWSSSTPYNSENIKIIYRNDATMQFSGGMKVVKNLFGEEELWFVTNRLQKFMNGNTDPSEVNYRIFVGVIRTLLNNQPRCNGQSLRQYESRRN